MKEINQGNQEFDELETQLSRVWKIADEFNLDPFATNFEIVPANIMYEFGAYGLPVRHSHWTYGRAYRQLKTQYDYGLSSIYELVINSDPSQAFLLETNPPIINTLVMAHVLGHTDFFKNNYLFLPTKRDMPYLASVRAARIEQHEKTHGRMEVEKFLDAALAIAEYIDPDPNKLFRISKSEQLQIWREEFRQRQLQQTRQKTDFDDIFGFNTTPKQNTQKTMPIPLDPEQDILGFISDFAPYLEPWQRDVIDIVRDESLYFRPQMRSKIMNEGWASFWHQRIMREMAKRKYIRDDQEEAWWKLNAGVLAASKLRLNPYHFGVTMFEYIEAYYNGTISDDEKRWLEHNDFPVYTKFTGPIQESPGRKKVFEVRRNHEDLSFIMEHFNHIVAARMGMYVYEKTESDTETDYVVVDKDWTQIRQVLTAQLTNSGFPNLAVIDGDHRGGGELYLKHFFQQPLDQEYLKKTLPYIYYLWQRPVHLETMAGGKTVIFSYDGRSVSTKS